MTHKVICLNYNVGYCKYKDKCSMEHAPKNIARKSALKGIDNNVDIVLNVDIKLRIDVNNVYK